MRIGIVGDEDFPRESAFFIFDAVVSPLDVIFSGECESGADKHIKEYCELNLENKKLTYHGIPPKCVKPELLTNGRQLKEVKVEEGKETRKDLVDKNGKFLRVLREEDFFHRNMLISFNVEELICLIHSRRYAGGAWNTLKHFIKEEKYNFSIFNEKGGEWEFQDFPVWLKKALKKKRKHKKLVDFAEPKGKIKPKYVSKYHKGKR